MSHNYDPQDLENRDNLDNLVGDQYTRKPSDIDCINEVFEASIAGATAQLPEFNVEVVFDERDNLDGVNCCTDFSSSFNAPLVFIINGWLAGDKVRILVSTEGANYIRYALKLV